MNKYAYEFLMNSSHSADLLISGYSILDDISILFTSSKSTTPSFSSTILDVPSEISSKCTINNNFNYLKVPNPQICSSSLSSIHRFDTTYEACQMIENENDNRINDGIHDSNQSHQETMTIVKYYDDNDNNKLEDCRYCAKHGNHGCYKERTMSNDSTNFCNNNNDICNLKSKTIATKSRKLIKANSKLDFMKKYGRLYSIVKSHRKSRSQNWSCNCGFTVPYGLCLIGFLFVIIGTGIFSGCWVYLVYASSQICNRVAYLHIIWYSLYIFNVFMVGFAFIIVILVSNSQNRHSIFSILKNPYCGKNCNIIVLLILLFQLLIWILLFTVIFYIIMDYNMNTHTSKIFCGVIELSINFSNITVNKENIKPMFEYSLLLSLCGSFIEILGLLLIIIGVSMNYQQMKAAIMKSRLLKNGIKYANGRP